MAGQSPNSPTKTYNELKNFGRSHNHRPLLRTMMLPFGFIAITKRALHSFSKRTLYTVFEETGWKVLEAGKSPEICEKIWPEFGRDILLDHFYGQNFTPIPFTFCKLLVHGDDHGEFTLWRVRSLLRMKKSEDIKCIVEGRKNAIINFYIRIWIIKFENVGQVFSV